MNIIRLFQIAAAKDHIAQYKISDPYLIYFLYQFDGIIPWKDAKAAPDINVFLNTYIKDQMLSKLQGKIDRNSNDNNYLKDLDVEAEFQGHMNNPQVVQAYNAYKANPEAGKKMLMDAYNGDKEKSFSEWWNYLTTQPKYSDNPSFSYCLLKKMIEASPSDKKAGTYSVQPTVVNFLFDEVAKNPKSQINLMTLYQKKYSEVMAAGLEDYDLQKEAGWKYIPSKITDPNNFQNNVKTLKDLSLPQGWCTGSYNAEPYLSMGDFYLYLVKGVAKVTIRMIGDGMGEIRGPNNTVATPWGEEVINFIYKKGFKGKWAYSDHLKELEQSCDFINSKFEKGEIRPDSINYGQYQRLNAANKAKLSNADKERIARDWALAGITTTTEIPAEFAHFPFVKEARVTAWKNAIKTRPEVYDTPDMPNDFKDLPEIKMIRNNAWMERLAMNPEAYETAPADIIADPEINRKVIDKSVEMVEKDPSSYAKLPLGIRRGEDRIIKLVETKILPKLADKIAADPKEYENIAYEFQNEPILDEAFLEGFIELLRRNPRVYKSFYTKTPHAQKLEAKIKKDPVTAKELKKAYDEGVNAMVKKVPLPPRPKKSFLPKEEKPNAQLPPPVDQPQMPPEMPPVPPANNDLLASVNWYERSSLLYSRMKPKE